MSNPLLGMPGEPGLYWLRHKDSPAFDALLIVRGVAPYLQARSIFVGEPRSLTPFESGDWVSVEWTEDLMVGPKIEMPAVI